MPGGIAKADEGSSKGMLELVPCVNRYLVCDLAFSSITRCFMGISWNGFWTCPLENQQMTLRGLDTDPDYDFRNTRK